MKATKQMPLDEAELQAVGFKLCSMKLIQLVRRNDVLYNRDAEGYTDKNQKELIWERVHKQLYPKYNTVSERIKQLIRNSVRRRWKTLRNAIAREVKRSATMENYTRKQESPIITELEFLIPHIKSAHCAKLTDELGLRENYQFMNETNDNDDEEDFDSVLIDLTDEFDVKPKIFKIDPDELGNGDDGAATDCSSSHSVMVSSEALYPTIQLATGVMTSNTNGDTDYSVSNDHKERSPKDNRLSTKWNKEFRAFAHYKGGEFTTVGDAVQDGEELNGHADEQVDTASSAKKQRTDDTTVDNIDWHARIAHFFKVERERNGGRFELRAVDQDDEDRMFLLSLVSDLKRIPTSKKPFIKAEIATVIARGLN